MIKSVKTNEDLDNVLKTDLAVAVYFSTEKCSVCKVLKPKVLKMLQEEYPAFSFVYVESDKTPEISSKYSVFSAPTILIFFDGKESYRKSRNFGINELSSLIESFGWEKQASSLINLYSDLLDHTDIE